MNDLISRQATLKHIEEIRQDVRMMNDTLIASLIMDGMYLCEEAVRNQPSAQPEIVRCEECNKSKEWPNGRWCSLFRASVNTDSYCSFGAKRKEGREE